ncbi:MAG TPA: hypothetical protein VFW63_00995 [Acidimicrobiales bacterium]|nr:hypothetical protein [Acidimicrobiales bacterium]
MVEVATCLVLDGPTGRWALVGAVGDLVPGDVVTVVGRPRPEWDSPCGHPVLEVRQVTPG